MKKATLSQVAFFYMPIDRINHVFGSKTLSEMRSHSSWPADLSGTVYPARINASKFRDAGPSNRITDPPLVSSPEVG